MEFLLIAVAILLTGVVAGFFSGMLGVGGTFILTPVTYWIFTEVLHIDPTIAIRVSFATSLAVVLMTTIAGAWGHRCKKCILIRAGTITGCAGLCGGLLGGSIATRIHGDTLALLFAGLLLIVSVSMVRKRQETEVGGLTQCSVGLFVLIGLFAGFCSGLLGIGGGLIIVPAFVILCRFPTHNAVGTSAIFMLITAMGSLAPYILNGPDAAVSLPFPHLGYIDLREWFLFIITTIPLSLVGVWAAHRMNAQYLRWILAALLFYSGVRMLWGVI